MLRILIVVDVQDEGNRSKVQYGFWWGDSVGGESGWVGGTNAYRMLNSISGQI